MAQADNEAHRHGSARHAFLHELRRAGMLDQKPWSLFVGFMRHRPIWYSEPGGVLVTAGARAGKLRDLLAYNICHGVCSALSMVILDPKGELAAISQDQTPDRKFVIRWNPAGLHGLSGCRFNPVSNLNLRNPNLVSDTKAFCENLVVETGSATGQYFESRARDYLEAIILALVERDGVLTLPALYAALNQLVAGGKTWLKGVGFDLAESRFEQARRVEAEIHQAHSGTDGGGFRGITGELMKAIAPLSDPRLMASVSPPFDFDLADLTRDDQAYQVYLMVPAEYLKAWGGVIKAALVNAMLYKARAPQAPRQVWILDEAAQACQGFPLLTQLFTYGAGIGITPVAVFQSSDQLKLVSPGAETIIPASAQLKIYFALRELGSATQVSRMMGRQSLHYDDTLQQSRAAHARKQAFWDIMNGADPVEAGMRAGQQARAEAHRSLQSRDLMMPSEVLGLAGDKMLLFVDGVANVILADRRPYWRVPWMAGRFHPNPYHPPLDRVQVKTFWGMRRRWVVEEPVPSEFAHYPQYASGLWSRISKERPRPCPKSSPSPAASPIFPERASLPAPEPVKRLPPPGPLDRPMKKL